MTIIGSRPRIRWIITITIPPIRKDEELLNHINIIEYSMLLLLMKLIAGTVYEIPYINLSYPANIKTIVLHRP